LLGRSYTLMSSIASFIKLPKTALDGLRQATAQGGFDRYLQQHGKPVADYDSPGFILATLLPYLEEQQIDLMTSEHDELATFLSETLQATCFIFTDAHRQAYAGKLTPESFSAPELGDYYNDFNATNEPNAGQPMLDGIRALQQSLSALNGDSVIVFSIV
jgi:hypothetical protein